jgi:hypothetical protein
MFFQLVTDETLVPPNFNTTHGLVALAELSTELFGLFICKNLLATMLDHERCLTLAMHAFSHGLRSVAFVHPCSSFVF